MKNRTILLTSKTFQACQRPTISKKHQKSGQLDQWRMNFVKWSVLCPVILVMTYTGYGQGKHAGYLYDLGYDEYFPLTFDRKYEEQDSIFITTYRLYNHGTKRHTYTVIATHYRNKKRVVVEVKDTSGGIFARINKESYKYDTSSLKPFGFRGAVGAMGGNRVPNQLFLKFVSNQHENVQVIHVNATSPGSSYYQFFILDKK